MPGDSIGPVFSVTYVNAAPINSTGIAGIAASTKVNGAAGPDSGSTAPLEGQRAPESIERRDELDLHVDLVLSGHGEIRRDFVVQQTLFQRSASLVLFFICAWLRRGRNQ